MNIQKRISVAVGKFFANVIAGFVSDKEKRQELRRKLNPLNPDRCIAYLEKHNIDEPAIPVYHGETIKNAVWVCWLQGVEQAPQIVRNCVETIKRHKHPDQQVVFITAENYADYVDLPDYIVKRWQKGQISNTHFSDMFRVHVLARHGGLWIDATCLLTAPFPGEILSAPLFLYHSHGEFSFTLIQTCLMNAEPNSYIMRKWCAAMNSYWKQESTTINYFVMHLMFIALLRHDERFANDYAAVPVISDESMHILLNAMVTGAPYSEELLNKARQATFVQKLTYKFRPELLEDKNSLAYYLSKKTTAA